MVRDTPSWLAAEFLTPAFFDDPYPFYRRLRTEAPVVWSEQVGAWLVSTFAEVRAGLSDGQLTSGTRIQDLSSALSPGARERGAGALACMARMMSFRDPPDHTRLRRLVSRAFTARRVADLEDEIESLVDELLDALPAAGPFDFVPAVAFPLPALVICRLLGIPDEHLPEVRGWADAVVNLLSSSTMTDVHVAAAEEAVISAAAFIRELVLERGARPRDDVLSILAAGESQADALTPDELTAMVILLFFAGFETTEGLIGNAVVTLARHPEGFGMLRTAPQDTELVVEEVLRYDTSVHRQSRIVAAGATLRGVDIPAGDVVLLMIGAANRDPDRFERADTFDPWRADAGNVSFGHGIHFCLGAPLARLETRVVLRSLARRIPGLRLAAPPEYGSLLAVRKPTSLLVTPG